MSLIGKTNEIAGDVRRAIVQLAASELTDVNGRVKGTSKIWGYVCKINKEGDLAGTVDVQEFNQIPGDNSYEGAGHHRGVLLTAIPENKDGIKITPMLYSEVVIVQNPADKKEYVIKFSFAQKIYLTAHSLEGEDDGEIEIGVTEVEDFSETDEGLDKDYYELEPTKNKTSTHYNATSIVDQIISPDDEEGLRQEKTFEHKIITVGDTTITIDGENVSIETSGKVSLKVNNTEIVEEDGAVTIKTDKAKVEASSCEVKGDDVKVDSTSCEIKGSSVKVDGGNVTITGGNLSTKGTCTPDLNGPYNAIKACPFSGAPHCGSMVSGT